MEDYNHVVVMSDFIDFLRLSTENAACSLAELAFQLIRRAVGRRSAVHYFRSALFNLCVTF